MMEQQDQLNTNYKTIDVLLVEDNLYDSELTIKAIKKADKKVKCMHLRDGAEAQKFIKDTPPFKGIDRQNLKLILLNLSLPKVDGFEVLKTIRKNHDTQSTPVVILTASEKRSRIEKAYKLGANSYVIKPTRYENYMNTVSTLTIYWTSVNEKPIRS